jgi:hypothetical protein
MTVRRQPPRRKSRTSTARARSPRPLGKRRRRPFSFKLPRSLPVQPSVVLCALGAFFVAWQLVIARAVPSAARWVPGRAAGLIGLLMIAAGLAALWMEQAGLRKPPGKPVSVRRSPTRGKSPSVRED